MSEYEAYWVMGFSLINSWARAKNNYSNLLKSKQTSNKK